MQSKGHSLWGQLVRKCIRGCQSPNKRRRIGHHRRSSSADALEHRILLSSIVWDGEGGDNDWNNAANWFDQTNLQNDVLPGSNDDVEIGAAFSGQTIIHSSGSHIILSLTCDASLSITGGTLTIGDGLQADEPASQISGIVSLISGTLRVDGDVTFSDTFDWTGGTLVGTGSTIIAAGAEMNINGNVHVGDITVQGDGDVHWVGGMMSRSAGTGNRVPTFDVANFNLIGGADRSLARVDLQNAGTMSVGGGGRLVSVPISGVGSTFSNLAGATLVVQDDFTLATQTPTSTLFDNSGSVQMLSGALTLEGHSNWNSGSSVTGDGWLHLSSATATMGDGFIAENIRLQGGTINAANDWTVTGRFDWASGTLEGTGSTIIAAGAEMNIDGDVRIADTTVRGDGDVHWVGGTMRSSGGTGNRVPTFDVATFNLIGEADRSLARVDLQNAGTMSMSGGGRLVSLSISGAGSTFSNLAGATLVVQDDFTLATQTPSFTLFDNSGSVQILSGSLTVEGHSSLNSGSSVTGDGWLHLHQPGGSLTATMGDGFIAENIRLEGSTINAANDWTVTGRFDWTRGILTGDGVTMLAEGAEMHIHPQGGDTRISGDHTISGDGKVRWTQGTLKAASSLFTDTVTFDVAEFLITEDWDKTLGVHLINEGHIEWAGGDILLDSGGTSHKRVLQNGEGATLVISSDGEFRRLIPSADNAVFENFGHLKKTSPGASSFHELDNQGTIEILDGSIDSGTAAPVVLGPNLYASTRPNTTYHVRGDFGGTTQNAADFDFHGRLVMRDSAGQPAPQLLEAMSEDRGAVPAGYLENFAINVLHLISADVQLADAADNAVGVTPEAVYVDALIVDVDSTLDLNGLNLYARTAQIDGSVVGGTIQFLSATGELSLNQPVLGNISINGEVDEWTFSGTIGQRIALIADPGEGSSFLPFAPFLGQARIELVAPNGVTVVSTESADANRIARRTGIRLSENGTYTVRVSAATADPDATGHYQLTVGEGTFDTAQLLLDTPELGLIEQLYSQDHWTFSGTANQVVQLDIQEFQAPGLEFELIGLNGWQGFVGQSIDSGFVTLPEDGEYVLVAQTAGAGTGVYTFQLNGLLATPLTLGVGEPGTLTGNGDAHLYSVQVPEANPLRVRFDHSSNADNVEVYLKRGSAPTRRDFDFQSTEIGADQTVIVPQAQAGEWFILVYGERVGIPGNFTIQADAAPAFLNTIAPDQANVDATLTTTINGTGFLPGTTVELISTTDDVIAGTQVSVDSYEQITATFDLSSVSTGQYDVRVTLPDMQELLLDDALDVVSSGEGILETELILPPSLGVRAPNVLYVEFANTGTAPLLAPILTLQSGDPDGSDRPLLTLDGSNIAIGVWSSSVPEGVTNSVQIYAQGSVAGQLLPGERIRVPIYYVGLELPIDTSDNAIEFDLLVHDADDPEIVDWSNYAASFRPETIPADAWDAIVDNLSAQFGVTWGDYIASLSETSSYLLQLGRDVSDVEALFNFEFLQASGQLYDFTLVSEVDISMDSPGFPLTWSRSFGNSISQRYKAGPFGRGWQAPAQASLVVLTDGTIAINESANTIRQFEPDSRYSDRFLSSPEETGELKLLPSGEYELRETDSSFRIFAADGKLLTAEDSTGNHLTYNYTADRLTSLSHSSGVSLSITYNPAGLIENTTTSTGWTVDYAYDVTNTVLESVTTPAGTTIYSYVTGQGAAREYALASVEDPSGVVRSFEYDASGRLLAVEATGSVARVDYTYDSVGRLTRTDAAGTSVTTSPDELGRLARFEDSSGGYFQYEYDAAGNLAKATDASGATQKFTWSPAGQLISLQDELGNELAFQSGGPNNLPLSFIDANGNTTFFRYDSAGNLLDRTFADGTTETFTYDAEGNRISYTNRRREIVEWRYNSLGQVTRQTHADGTEVNYEYDALNRLISVDDDGELTTYAYFADNQLQRIDSPNSRWLEYDYDAAGRITRLEDHTGHVVQYLYDSAGRLVELQDASDASIVIYAYDSAGRLHQETKANGTTTTYEYDAVGRISTVLNEQSDGTDNSRFDYTYDALGRRIGMTTLDGTWTYEYDPTGQLVHAVFASTNPSIPNQDLSYAYDAAGNRTELIDNIVSTAYSTNNMNQITSAGSTTFEYDDDGNLIRRETPTEVWTYAYDAENQLIQVNGPSDVWEYEYDAFGNRTAVIENGVRTEFLLDPTGLVNVVGTYDAAGNRVDSYVHGLGLEAVSTSSSQHFFDFDALGSTSGLTDATGTYVNSYAYTPFGMTLLSEEAVENSFEYVGEFGVTNEDNGFYFMRARYYSPEEARFAAQDPIRLKSGDVNYYRYAQNNPLLRIDPAGLTPSDPSPFVLSKGQSERPLEEILSDLDPTNPDNYRIVNCGNPLEGTWGDRSKCTKRTLTVGSPFCLPDEEGQYPCETLHGGRTGKRFSKDPNEKLPGSGFGVEGFITTEGLIPYTVRFENLGPGSEPAPSNPATAPAQRVVVTDQLSSDLDWSTLQFTGFGFGDTFVTINEEGFHHFETLSLTIAGKTFDVDVELTFNSSTGQIRAAFQSLDPTTDLPPDVLTGFLPPEDGTGIGQGFISFTILPISGLPTGTEIRNIAEITFDGQAIIATNQIDPEDPSQGTDPMKEALITIDAVGPSSEVAGLPATSSDPQFLVEWSGADDTGGSGIADYTVFVSTDSGPYEVWLANTTKTSSIFTGIPDSHYAFYTIATDNVGHVELAPQTPDAEVAIVSSFVIDDGDVGFSTVGSWTFSPNPNGRESDVRNSFIGKGQNVARWEFTGLTAGNYRVSATWPEHPNRATNSPFRALDAVNGTVFNQVTINQELAPDDFSEDGTAWEDLFIVTVVDGTLVVELSNAANQYVIADAIRIEPTTEAPTSAARIIDDGDFGFETTGEWNSSPIAHGHENDLRNHAAGNGSNTATWTFTGLTPGNYQVSATWFAHANRATNSPFSIFDGIGGPLLESVLVNQRMAPDDFSDSGSNWENLTVVTITGTELVVELDDHANGYVIADAIRIESTVLESLPPGVIIDDGNAGFASTVGWTPSPLSHGREGDLLNAPAGDGSAVATWTFTGLTSGSYRVSATWVAHPNRATNAPFRLRDGVGGPDLDVILLDRVRTVNCLLAGGVSLGEFPTRSMAWHAGNEIRHSNGSGGSGWRVGGRVG